MIRKVKRGYFEQSGYDKIKQKYNGYAVSISNIEQCDDNGFWEDKKKTKVGAFGGFKTRNEAIDFLISQKVQQIYDLDKQELIIFRVRG